MGKVNTSRSGLICAVLAVLAVLAAGALVVVPSSGHGPPASSAAAPATPSLLVAAGDGVSRGAATSARRRPNVVLITTDDMRADDLLQMPRTRRLLGRLDLDDFVSNHPLCCPARAELLTGQLAQHNGVRANTGRWGGYDALRGKNNTLARWFQRRRYDTAIVGKFVNGWCPSSGRPAGWRDFTPLVKNAYSPYHYSYVDRSRTRSAPRGLHTNDFVTQRTLSRFRTYAEHRRPFLVWSSYVAPHDMEVKNRFVPPVPAKRHRGALAGIVPVSESAPSYERPRAVEVARAAASDSAACAGEGAERVTTHSVRAARAPSLRRLNQRRLESLLSVDEGIGRMVRTLRRLGELRRTVFVFTSDNGYQLGEHGLVGKNFFYEESLRVPLLARGPGVARGTSSKGAMITDIAPSLARLASVAPRRRLDGRRDLFATRGGWRRLLIQTADDGVPWLWRGVRTSRWTYVEVRGGRVVLHDRGSDPFQLQNVARREPDVVRTLRARLRMMKR